ncbi:MAG: MFS transporter [Hoeflea sp.]|uniref:MFS transporter n=1 Tax=Hoeflea sp. TaxID=1940281 RepID=UPI001D856086|nr:MFS transporter [Hoeflea sp.]MBU4530458.1 MFS transporter [Alphaproteobacteria bacterium]MBU4545245.1 MFS transporter [Alphaproteobacteria bacterium]MBU4549555.1 MFS transporter [Alphaproteobacteria bacterium]MBV1722048.1 MFS transporter [Hoeflea sp.]MBV1761398.1 MFS transporter [Hoeflea sp.]
MPILNFLRDNARWIAGGFLLTFFSSFGQTYFIALSAGDIRTEYGLSHGGFGTLYMLATLASAASLPLIGRVIDRISVASTVLLAAPILAIACILMAWSNSLVVLVLAIYLLRLFGQGMLSHIAFTAMGRWFAAQRGRAVSLTAIGVNVGEAVFPISFVAVAALIGWRGSWLLAAGVLMLVALPAIYSLLKRERTPQSVVQDPNLPVAREWTRGEVVRDPLFWAALMGVLAPPFIGTTVFFHQVYLSQLRGWDPSVFAASFAIMSAMTILFALIAGQLIDRFSAIRILPSFLLPLSLSCFVLASTEAPWGAYAFMALMGVSYGFSSTLFGALWPELYGTRNLGAIRSLIVAFMVFATAVGPGLTGWLIDAGVSYPGQIVAMGVYCAVMIMIMTLVSRRALLRRPQAAAMAAKV